MQYDVKLKYRLDEDTDNSIWEFSDEFGNVIGSTTSPNMLTAFQLGMRYGKERHDQRAGGVGAGAEGADA